MCVFGSEPLVYRLRVSPTLVLAAVLHALPTSWFKPAFRLVRDEREVGHLAMSSFRERATFTVKDVEFAFYRESMAGDFVLEFQGSVLARAQKASAFRQRFTLAFEGQSYTLAPVTWFGRTFVLREGGEEVGHVRPLSAFSHKTDLDLPDALPLPLRVFCFWLVLILWKRAAAAASG